MAPQFYIERICVKNEGYLRMFKKHIKIEKFVYLFLHYVIYYTKILNNNYIKL